MIHLRRPYAVRTLMTVTVLCFVQSTHSVAAAGQGQGRHLGQEKRSEKEQRERGSPPERGYRFAASEREIISGYYANPSRGLPPGLAKRGGDLPPGLERQLVRNGTLPPGLQKRLQPLPVDLERRLPPLPADCGCRRAIIGSQVLLIRTRSFSILDVLHVVIR